MKPHYETAIKAACSIEFYRDHYASSKKSAEHRREVLEMLREGAKAHRKSGGEKFLLAFADALDQSFRPGKYVSPFADGKK